VEGIEGVIKQLEDEDEHGNIQQINYLKRMYNKLALRRHMYIKIGGAAYDNATAIDELIDVLGATRCSLQHGCVRGGMKTLKKIVNKLLADAENTKDKKYYLLCNSLLSVLNEFHATLKELVTDVDYDVIQSKCVDINFVERFGELVLKLIATDKIIICGDKCNDY
jgi:hypothetical protein